MSAWPINNWLMYVCMYIYIHTIIYLCTMFTPHLFTMFIQLTTEKTLAGKEWVLISSRALQVCLHHRVVNNLTQIINLGKHKSSKLNLPTSPTSTWSHFVQCIKHADHRWQLTCMGIYVFRFWKMLSHCFQLYSTPPKCGLWSFHVMVAVCCLFYDHTILVVDLPLWKIWVSWDDYAQYLE